jgi:hypothetical protein
MPSIKKDFSVTKGVQVQGSIKLGSSIVTSIVDSATVTQIVQDSAVASSITSAGGLIATNYASVDLLPASGNTAGDFGFVTSVNRLFIWNGIGWYNIALVNTTPTFDSLPNSSYILDSNAGIATTITLNATDPEEVPITYSYVASDSASDFATISQSDNVITVTALPKATVWANVGPGDSGGGTFTITFKASDGINIVPAVSSFTLTINLANSYSLNSDTPQSFVSSPSMASLLDGPDVFDGNIDINYDGTAIVTGTGSSNPIVGNSSYNNHGALAYIVKQSGTWVRTVNKQNINYRTSPGNGRIGVYGVTVSPNGKRSASMTSVRLSNANGPTLARPIHDWASLSITDAGAYSPAYNQTQVSVPTGPGGTHNADVGVSFLSPFVGEVGGSYSYALFAQPSIKNTSSTFTFQGLLRVIRNDETSTSSNGLQDLTYISNTLSNHRAGQKGGAINHQGDRMVYCAGSNIFDYYKAASTAGYVTTAVSAGSLSSIGGISAANLAPAGNAMRFDSNYNLYVHGGSQIAVFDLTNGTSSDFNAYTTIDLSTLLATSPLTGTAITWNTDIDAFSVSYDGQYMVTVNGNSGSMYILDKFSGTWAVTQEIAPPVGIWETAAISGDGNTIVARTSTNAVYIYEAT